MQNEAGKRYVEYAVTVTGYDIGEGPPAEGAQGGEVPHSYTVWRRYSEFVK